MLTVILLVALCPATSVAQTPKKHRVADWKFWLLVGAHVAASAADIESTRWTQRHCLNCRESNFLLGRHPSFHRLVLTDAAITGGLSAFTWQIKKMGQDKKTGRDTLHGTWAIPQGIYAAEKVFAARHNWNICETDHHAACR